MKHDATRLGETPINKLILQISLPLMISLLVQSLYNLVDSFFVARLSETALSATSLASPIQMLMIAVSVGTGVGVNSLLSRTLGAKDRAGADKVATTGLVLACLSCILFVIFGLFLTKPFLRMFVSEADTELMEMGSTYLGICTVFSLGIFVATTAERLLQATGRTQLSMWAQISGAVTNCILDPIMIFGLLGFPEMGIAGAAVATVIGQWLAAIIALILNFRLNHDVTISFKGFRLEKETVAGIYKVGAPAMLVSGLGSIQTICINKILIGFSGTAVAFFGLFHKMQSFVQMPVNGLAQGLIPIVGYAYGAGKGSRIREAADQTSKYAAALVSVFTMLFLLFPSAILGVFSAGEQMRSIGIPGLRILCLSFMFMTTSTVIGNIFTGMGNGLVNMISTFLRIGISLVLVILLRGHGSLNVLWAAIPVADACAAVYAIMKWNKAKKEQIPKLTARNKAL